MSESKLRPQVVPLKSHSATPFKEMTRDQKVRFLAKLIICVVTFGMVFPNVMSD